MSFISTLHSLYFPLDMDSLLDKDQIKMEPAVVWLNYTCRCHVLILSDDVPPELIKRLSFESWIIPNKNLKIEGKKVQGWIFPSTDGGIFYLHAVRLILDDAGIDHELKKIQSK